MLSIEISNTLKKRLNRMDNERLAIAILSFLGLALLIPLLVISPGLLEAEWFLNPLVVLAEYGGFITAGAYIGRLVNLVLARSLYVNNEAEKTKVSTILSNEIIMNRRIGRLEKFVTPLGMLLGIALGITCLLLHVAVPFFSIYSYFSYIIFVLGYCCTLGGWFNRLGSSMDGTRLNQEKRAIIIGSLFGFMFAMMILLLLLTSGTLPLVAVAGVSQFFLNLFMLNKTLFIVTFICSISSISASFSDYFAKAYGFFKYWIDSDDSLLNERIKLRYHEYRGAFLGIISGLILTLIITTGLGLTGGLAAAPVVVITTFIITTLVCNSTIPALFSRIGRVIDGLKKRPDTQFSTGDPTTDEPDIVSNPQLSRTAGSSTPSFHADSLSCRHGSTPAQPIPSSHIQSPKTTHPLTPDSFQNLTNSFFQPDHASLPNPLASKLNEIKLSRSLG